MSGRTGAPKKRKSPVSDVKTATGSSGNSTAAPPGRNKASGGGSASAAGGGDSAQRAPAQHKQKHHRLDPAGRTTDGSSSQTPRITLKRGAAVTTRAGMMHASGRGEQSASKHDRKRQQRQQPQHQHQKQRRSAGPTGQRPQVLLHELAAQKYSAFLAGFTGHAHLPPLSYYRRPRRKRQRPGMIKATVALRVPQAGPVEGTHIHQFAPEWRQPMTVEPEQLGAFYKPGGGVIEPTLQPPPELKLAGIQGKDLNTGYLTYVEPDTASSTSEITEMLDETPGLEREEESAHFITYRNNLNKIVVAPYSKQKWEMEVIKEGGVIHLEVVHDRNRGKMDRTSYWGRRFETLCVLGVEGARMEELQRAEDDPPRPSYCGLYRSRLGSHNLLMGAEIDACRPSDPGRFVEIKTTRNIRDAKDEQIFKKHKTLKYWAQCYLAGVRDLVIGYRDDHGIVREIKSWTTDALVDAVDKFKHWDKDVCLNFADRCLTFLKDNVDEGPRYSFKYGEPFEEITLEVIGAAGVNVMGDGGGFAESMYEPA